jgi:hypothetical protein
LFSNVDDQGQVEKTNKFRFPPSEIQLAIPELISQVYPILSPDQLREFKVELQREHDAFMELNSNAHLDQFYDQIISLVCHGIVNDEMVE